jgi:hypothetical protein
VGKIVVVAFRGRGETALAQDARTAFVQLIDQRPIVGLGVLPLLMRAREVEVGFARQQIKAMQECLAIAAYKGVNVVARQIAVPYEQLENVDVALGRIYGAWRTGAADNRFTGPS